MAADADFRAAEGDRQVEQQDDPDRGGKRVDAAAAGDDEGRAEDAEDRQSADVTVELPKLDKDLIDRLEVKAPDKVVWKWNSSGRQLTVSSFLPPVRL